MHDAHFPCYEVSLRVARPHSHHRPHSRSPHSHTPYTRSPHSHALQELKDDLLDDATWPVMQWLNEDH